MKRLLLTVAFAGIAVSSWALWVSACDQKKDAAAASSAGAASHCAAKSGASAAECSGHQKNATASAQGAHCAGKTTATTASTKSAAGSDACCMKDTKTTTAAAQGSSCAQGLAFAGVLAMPAGGPACSNGQKSARNSHDAAHGDGCDACSDMASCSEELKAHGTQTQVVPLKNGVMFVYTAASANSVRAVQAAMVRRSEKLNAITASGDRASLCPECRTIRGAMASGKMNRETINIEGGCLTLFTSTDMAMVKKLRGMSSAQSNRMKS